MIKPTIGRVVWYWAPDRVLPEQPFAALVAHVWSDTCVNIAYFDEQGRSHNATSVPLYQGDTDRPDFAFCEWMPFQKGQAAKTEQLESAVAAANVHAMDNGSAS